jgi:hypothetical protein
VTVDEIAKQLNISIGPAYSVVHDNLQFLKVYTRWVPKKLTDEHKHMHLNVFSCHVACNHEEGDSVLQRIITGDETWVHHCQPKTKRNSMQWKDPSSHVAKKSKMQPLVGKLMLIILWDSQGPILETYLEHGTTVTNATYCDMLQRVLKPAIRSRRRERLSEGVFLLHDSAHPHTVARKLETIRKLKWQVMEHPAHSPDLVPSDFHLFGPIKEALGGRRF